MKVRELEDFEGSINAERVAGGVEIRASDHSGTRLVFTLSSDEAQVLISAIRRTLEIPEPEPLAAIRERKGRELQARREALDISRKSMALMLKTSGEEIVAIESGSKSQERVIAARMATLLDNMESASTGLLQASDSTRSIGNLVAQHDRVVEEATRVVRERRSRKAKNRPLGG